MELMVNAAIVRRESEVLLNYMYNKTLRKRVSNNACIMKCFRLNVLVSGYLKTSIKQPNTCNCVTNNYTRYCKRSSGYWYVILSYRLLKGIAIMDSESCHNAMNHVCLSSLTYVTML